MNSERWEKLEELFHATLEREPPDRGAFISASCQGDEELRQELRSMIEHHEQAGDLLETPAYQFAAESILEDGSSDELIGKTFGQYEILRLLGKGGLGQVFLAFDHTLRRNVALKFLNENRNRGAGRMQRLKAEAHAASALNHPNILTILDIGEISRRQFIVTEFVEGETLRQHLAKPCGLRQGLDVCSQIASALTAAHAAGIVHRDIKPENVMLRHDGFIKVLDFGLAGIADPAAIDGGDRDSHSGLIAGTVQYMSPEQLRGQPVDERADLWSLGVVLFEMLAGSTPFKGESHTETIEAILNLKPSFDWRTNDLPPELEWILKKALSKDREARYQSAKELGIDLRRLSRELDAERLWQRTPAMTESRTSNSGENKLRSFDSARPLISARKRVPKTISSLAVLPLVNVNADPETEYLSDGLTENIINNLAQLPKLRVMARSIVFRYKGRHIDPQEIGDELGVHAVLTGRVQQANDSLVISAELVRVADGSLLWSQHFNSHLYDIFSLQEEIARQVSEKLQPKSAVAGKKHSAKRPTQNAEAYQLYLKGRYFWNKRTPEGFQKAIQFFEKATALDRNYALAYSGLADCSTLLNYYSVAPAEVTMAQAKAATEKALTADESLAEAHASAAMVAFWYDWDWLRARIEFERALQLDPAYAPAHEFFGWYLLAMGQFDRAADEGQLAIDPDPLAPATNLALSKTYFFSRRYDDAIKLCRHTLSLDSSFVPARYFLGRAYLQKRKFAEALAQYEKGLNVVGKLPFGAAVVAHAQALSGDNAAAQTILDKLLDARSAQKTYIPAFGLAMIYAGLKNKREAIEWLEQAFDERSLWMVYLNVDPAFDDLRGEVGFKKLVRRMKFPEAGKSTTA